jgi:hypothetical protein
VHLERIDQCVGIGAAGRRRNFNCNERRGRAAVAFFNDRAQRNLFDPAVT